ncbi:hypothetical protein NSS70_11425 [Aeribacillus sp. FSL K6-2848]
MKLAHQEGVQDLTLTLLYAYLISLLFEHEYNHLPSFSLLLA